MPRYARPLALHSFCGSCIPLYPLFTLLLIDHGVSAYGLSVLLAVWAIVGFVLTVPFGALADRTSRKWLLVIGQLIGAVGFALWGLLPNFTGYFVGFVLWGAKSALIAGTREAYVYDELVALGRQGEYATVYGRVSMLYSIASLLGALLAVPLSGYGYEPVIWSSVAMHVLSAIAAIFLPEAPRSKKTGKGAYLLTLRAGFRVIFSSRAMLVTAASLGIAGAFIGMSGDYAPILGRLSGLPLEAIGVLVAISYGLLAFANLTASALRARVRGRFIWLFPIGSLCFTVAAVVMSVPTLISVFVWIYAVGVSWQMHNADLQDGSTSDVRATTASVAGLAMTSFQAGMTTAFGLVAGAWSYGTALIFFGCTALVISGLLALLHKRRPSP